MWDHVTSRVNKLISCVVRSVRVRAGGVGVSLRQGEGLHDERPADGAVLEARDAPVAHARVSARQQHAVDGAVLAHHTVSARPLAPPLLFFLLLLLLLRVFHLRVVCVLWCGGCLAVHRHRWTLCLWVGVWGPRRRGPGPFPRHEERLQRERGRCFNVGSEENRMLNIKLKEQHHLWWKQCHCKGICDCCDI